MQTQTRRVGPFVPEDQLPGAFLKEVDRRYQPERVLMEYNGMWPIQILRDLKLPKTWGLYQAIDVIDEACSRVRLSTLTAPPDLKQLEDEIAAIAAKKEEAVKGQDYENAAKLRDEEKAKRDALEARKKEWSDEQNRTHGAVTPDDIAAVISG